MSTYFESPTHHRRRLSQNLIPERMAAIQGHGTSPAADDDVELLNVTALDVRCLISANPESGDTVSFDVQRRGGRLTTLSGIVHWKELRRVKYEIGMYLPGGLPAGMSDHLTASRRKSNRYRCRQSGVFYRQETQLRTEAIVVNYCYDGFAVQTPTFCSIDDVIHFEWTCERNRQEITGEVLWQIEQQHGVLLGCQTEPGVGYRLAGLSV